MTTIPSVSFAPHLLALVPIPQVHADETVPQLHSSSSVTRLQRWRAANPEEFEKRRVAGMRRSPKVRANLLKLHREHKEQWHASARRNPKLRATNVHIAAKEWVLRAPDGQTYRFRNLKQFVRDQPGLFDAADVEWREVPGRPSQAWCRAFHGLSRLRPSCVKQLPEWREWTWAGE